MDPEGDFSGSLQKLHRFSDACRAELLKYPPIADVSSLFNNERRARIHAATAAIRVVMGAQRIEPTELPFLIDRSLFACAPARNMHCVLGCRSGAFDCFASRIHV